MNALTGTRYRGGTYAARAGGCCDDCSCGSAGGCPDCGTSRAGARFRSRVMSLGSLGSVTSQPRATRGPRAALIRQGLFADTMFRGGLGDTTTPDPVVVPVAADSTVLDTVNARADQLMTAIKEQDRLRKIALVVSGAAALFAALKLGIIGVQHVRSRDS